METLKTKRVRFYDNGLFHGFARHIAPQFAYADYWTPWANENPSQKQTRLGEGFPELKRVNYADDDEDKVDLHAFLDLFHADRARRLRRQGKRVWAAGTSEAVELDRIGFREWAKIHGFPMAPATLVTGTDELRRELLKHKTAWVKMADGHNRGDGETWKWKGDHIGTPRLDEKIYDAGAFKSSTKYLVEEEIKDAIELGEDLTNVCGAWPDHIMQGMEVKGLGTVGIVKPYAQLPDCLKRFNEKLSKVFAQDKASTFFCMEGLYTQARKYYPMDPCVRLGSPSNELLGSLFTPESLARMLWDGASGEGLPPAKMTSWKPAAKYGIVTMAYNEQSGKNWMPLSYPKEADPWVYLRNPYSLNGKRYAVPQGSPTNLAGVVGIGDSLLDAARNMAKHAKMIDGNSLEIATDALAKMLEIIKKSNAWGATFTTEPLPSAEELKRAIS